jgi:aflatoxin B1 aldehyde reductase
MMQQPTEVKALILGFVCGVLVTKLVVPLLSPTAKNDGKHTRKNPRGLPQVIYGTMTIPSQTPIPVATQMLKRLVEVAESSPGGVPEIDTARVYEEGKTELSLGEIFASEPALAKKLTIASKVNPRIAPLTKDQVWKQFKETCEALKRKSIDILYLHAPDSRVSVLETLEGVQEIYKAGGFKELGLSNFQSWEVVQIYHICEKRGWVVPTVYQGMYNCITREVERELFPALRTLGIRFYAYNPLAGGFLSGKHTKESIENVTEGRFRMDNKSYRERYLTDTQFDALEKIQAACQATGIPMAEAAIRWEFHHSQLKGNLGDGVIIGASKLSYFEENLAACTTKCRPLPDSVVSAMNEAWDIIQKSGTCPSYERGHSKLEMS